jgi:hypothetical protein
VTEETMTTTSPAPASTIPLPGRSQVDRLIAVVDGAELFFTPAREAYVSFTIEGHRETWPVASDEFRRLLLARYYAAEKTAPSAQAVIDARNVIEARALFEGTEQPVFTRVGAHGDAIYLDIGDSTWQAIEISADGWTIVDVPPVRFRRAPGILALPNPDPDGSIYELRELVNVRSEDDWLLMVSWLLAAMRPVGPYPLLVLHGEQGSAKSTTARMLRTLVDPSAASLRSAPRNERDLAIAARHGWILAFDNLSRIDAAFSDALCRMSTGGTFTTRRLHTDAEEVVISTQRPVIITGIEELATRSDLLDRSLVIELPVIRENSRRSEGDLWSAFETRRARIFGALLEALSGALRKLPKTTIAGKPRMADFALWATAAESSLGIENGSFMSAYHGNRLAANDVAMDSSPIAGAILDLMRRRNSWTGTATELLQSLGVRLKSPIALSRALRRLAPNLRVAGIEIGFDRDPGSSRQRIVKLSACSSEAAMVPASLGELDSNEESDAHDDRDSPSC